jgi:formylglycine-generating enzyme required for sulfatase activity
LTPANFAEPVYSLVNFVNEHLPYRREVDGAVTIRNGWSGSERAAGVSFAGAVACAGYFGGRLPSEAEWEAALTWYLQGTDNEATYSDWQDFRQWCSDVYHPDHPYYAQASGAERIQETEMRVVRGGAFNRSASDVHWSARNGKWVRHGGDATGVRVVWS